MIIYFKINDVEYEIDERQEELTVLQGCLKYGIEIPRFCYHEKLTIAGNCRMCLVYVTNNEKLVASCGLPLDEDFDDEGIYTEVDEILRAREGVMEFLLINHPLDCPICDQGGECDLQDQTMLYGLDTGRFYINKRAVEIKNFGVLIKAIMTRCIHCTRCVRFLTEIAGVYNLGVLGRGFNMEIGTYNTNKNIITSEVSGNIIDLCPVGALTSQMYAYKGRPWELKSINGLDVFDPLLTNVNIQLKGLEIMRILPKSNDDINEEWLTDKLRFHYDSYKKLIEKRSKFPKYKLKNNKYIIIDWKKAIRIVFSLIFDANQLEVIFGNKLPIEVLALYKGIFNKMGVNTYSMENVLNYGSINYDFRENYLNKNILTNVEKNDLVFLIGSNLRVESPLLNIRLRNLNFNEEQVKSKKIIILGNKFFWKADSKYIGSKISTLLKVLEGRHEICKSLSTAKNPLIIFGSNCYLKFNFNFGKIKNYFIKQLNLKSENLIIINKEVNFNSAMELGLNLTKIKNNKEIKKVVYCIDSTEFDVNKDTNQIIIYQGIINEYLENKIDLYLPSKFYFEDKLEFINMVGKKVESAPINITSNSTIKLHKLIGKVFYYFVTGAVNVQANTYIKYQNEWSSYASNKYEEKEIFINKYLTFNNIISDYYSNDMIIRNSKRLEMHKNMLKNFKNNYKQEN
uniref:NADH-ubiquinone oxidoreductase 75 kDa subunit n=1 Tax=Cavenderia fasciculata TaxID=261658 RepID=B2XXA6_CACFS|nr:NADH dehydrogenase subunit 11 [Cavenderia fasciculata]ABX45228.1 NADH dehydrogenase subunit 11 [Cavenderia fasciculata]